MIKAFDVTDIPTDRQIRLTIETTSSLLQPNEFNRVLSSDLESRVPDLYNVTVNSLRKDNHHYLGFLLWAQGLRIRIRLVWSDQGPGCFVGSGSGLFGWIRVRGVWSDPGSLLGKGWILILFLEKGWIQIHF